MSGTPANLESDKNLRRTCTRINRQRLNSVLKLYDLPDPLQTSPGRLLSCIVATAFVMNGSFIQKQAEALAKALEARAGRYRQDPQPISQGIGAGSQLRQAGSGCQLLGAGHDRPVCPIIVVHQYRGDLLAFER